MKNLRTFKQFINESQVESIAVVYKDREYWVDTKDLKNPSHGKIFAFEDPGLQTIATINGKSLMFKISDIEDKLKEDLNEASATVLSPEMGGGGPVPKGFLKVIWELPVEELQTLLTKSQDDLKWLKANSRGTLGAFNRKDAQIVTSRISLMKDLIKRKKEDPNVEKPDWLKESVKDNTLLEASDITPERMLMSVYDRIKAIKSIKVGKINTKDLYFDFEVDVKSYIGAHNTPITDNVKGNVEARGGKILVSFDKVVFNPTQYDITFDGEHTLTKDYTRDKVAELIKQHTLKFRK
jgi:hypothetical protein